jgi:hypothetical protein
MHRALALAALAAAGCASTASAPGAAPPATERESHARIAPMTDAAAWDRMPKGAPPLPVWARTLADSLPRTTAFQLDLDAVHRTKSPLGPVLAGKIRWTVADALRCAYAKESVEADLAKAGQTEDQIRSLSDAGAAPDADAAALAFARRLTVDGSALTDEEVADLIAKYGPDDAVGIVHTVAHANFQDRLFLALGLTSEPGGPAPPREVRPTADEASPVPERTGGGDARHVAGDGAEVKSTWSAATYSDLRARLDAQKERKGRIERPTDAGRLARVPRPYRERMGRVAWGSVSMGYQPVLTNAWFQTMDTFAAEAKLDETFGETVFWIVTRTNDCFY